MRLNTIQVFRAWRDGVANQKQNSVWTDGVDIYSYGTTLVTRIDDYTSPDGVILNRTKYSKTTTQHQNNLAVLLGREGIPIHEADDAPIGIQPNTLWRMVTDSL